ncbi:MAG: hypothetical protein HGA36_01855 [Candidatus Moranbacteria bacterium]|nr:hypothetical protein [Candidatus Moranbacteria bacterium]
MHITKINKISHLKVISAETAVCLMLMAVFSASFAQASDITSETVINLVNKARESANVATLKRNDLLEQAAKNKANDMIENDYFAHISPEGKSPWFWIDGVGYDYRFAGENLAINFTNAKDEQQAWMDSELHRKNILNPDYTEIGVAVKDGVIDGHKTTVAVQMFGTQFPVEKAVVSVVAPEKPAPKTVVAGVVTTTVVPVKITQDISAKIDLKTLYADNQLAFMGWFGAIGLALIIIIVDVLAIFHKRHEQLFILKDARNRHT